MGMCGKHYQDAYRRRQTEGDSGQEEFGTDPEGDMPESDRQHEDKTGGGIEVEGRQEGQGQSGGQSEGQSEEGQEEEGQGQGQEDVDYWGMGGEEGNEDDGGQGQGEGDGEEEGDGEGEGGQPSEMPAPPEAPGIEGREDTAMDSSWEEMGKAIGRETERDERSKWLPVYEQCREIISRLEKERKEAPAGPGYTPSEMPGFDEIDYDKIGPVHSVFGEMLEELSLLENVVLIGPAGSGKTSAARKAAEALGLDYYSHGAIFSKHETLGYLDAKGERAITAMYRWATNPNGGVLNFDELDGSLPKAITPLHELLDNRSVEFPGGLVVELTDRHLVVASMNTYGTGASRLYVGRNALDQASLDRFVQIECGYDNAYEKAIFGYGAEDKFSKRRREWIDEVQLTRQAVDNLRKERVVSMRASRRGVRAIESGQKLTTARKKRYLFSGLDDGQIRQIRQEMRRIEEEAKAKEAKAETEGQ